MFLSDRTMKLLMEMTAPSDEKVALLASMRADEQAAMPVRSAAAERQARYRDKKASQPITEHNAVTESDDSNAQASPALAPPPSPQAPQPPPHTRERATTREREDAAFARFWADYPRKTAKADARKAYCRAFKKLPPFEEETIICGGLERAKAAWTEAQFIPHAATWLNGERWNDEPPEITPRKAPHERPHHHDKPTAREDRLGRMLRGALAAVDEREAGLGRSGPIPSE